MSGISAAGFTKPRLVDIQSEIFQTLTSVLGATVNTLPQSVISQLVGVFSEREDLIWQANEDVYNSQYPDLAFGVSLDNAASLSGAVRKGPLPSTVAVEYLFGTAGTFIPQGSQIAVSGAPANVFQTDAPVTLAAGQNCIQTLTFSLVPTSGHFKLAFNAGVTGNIAFNASAASIQTALQALPFGAGILVTGNFSIGFTITFTGAAGLQTQPALIVEDNTLANGVAVTIAVTIAQPGINQGSVSLTAINTGPLLAPAGELISIVTPINGWASALNKLDATVGRNVETDNEFKQRRRSELQLAGAATVPAIRSHLLEISDVTAALVFENDSLITDGFGNPAKSINCVVQGGTNQEIWNEIFAVKAGGILAYGQTCGTVVDSQGQSHNICFDRPTPVLIYINITITKNSNFPSDGVATIQQELTTFGNALGIGKEVVVIPYLISAIANIPGIEDAVLLIGTAPSPTLPDNIPIAANEIAEFDTSRIIVVTV